MDRAARVRKRLTEAGVLGLNMMSSPGSGKTTLLEATIRQLSGELRFAVDALFMPDGTVGLVQPFPGRIVKVDRDGLPAGVFKVGEEGAIVAVPEARARGGNLVLGVIDYAFPSMSAYVSFDGGERCIPAPVEAHRPARPADPV